MNIKNVNNIGFSLSFGLCRLPTNLSLFQKLSFAAAIELNLWDSLRESFLCAVFSHTQNRWPIHSLLELWEWACFGVNYLIILVFILFSLVFFKRFFMSIFILLASLNSLTNVKTRQNMKSIERNLVETHARTHFENLK